MSGKPFVGDVKVEPYRAALTFLGQGALLSLSGDNKVGFLVRDVEQVEVEIGRVLPNQLQHLAPQMWDFCAAGLYGGLEDKLVERFIDDRDYSGKQPGKPTYDSIDVGQYLAGQRPGHAAACSCCTSAPIASPRRRRTTDDQEEARTSRRQAATATASKTRG